MRTQKQVHGRGTKLGTALVLGLAAVAVFATPASAGGGGTSISGSDGGSASGSCSQDAKLVRGKAIAPDCAPHRIKQVIAAANDIRNKPYVYGGGHSKWRDRGYDCSGAVSYALHGGRLLRKPLDSSGFMRWAHRGKGDWFTVLANPGHAFLVVAGLRFDTSTVRGDGPGWSRNIHAYSWRDYRKRHMGRF